MTWLKSLVKRAAKYAGIPLRDPALVQMLGNTPTAAGVDVDANTAMTISAVWQAVNIIASNVAAMPPIPYYESNPKKRQAVDHPIWDVLLIEPNDEMTPFTFYETLQAHALTWGNGYAAIQRDGEDGPLLALDPLMPNQTTPERNQQTGVVEYRFQAMYPGEVDRIYQAYEVLHIAGVGFDGLKGYNVIDQARESLGLTAGVEKYGAAFFGRGSTPGGILEIPQELELSEKAKKNLRESFELMHRGPDNAHRVAVLEDGVTYKTLGLPLETAQFLQTRQFQVVEVARWFNLPPHLLRDLLQATFSNIEHQGIDFLVYTLRPWLIRWSQEIRRKLFLPHERRSMCIEHDTQNLLLTDIKARYEAYKMGREGGWLTLDDILARERLNPVTGNLGASRLVPANMRAVMDDGSDVFASETGQVEATAMNGIQVTAMQAVVTACAAKTLHPDSAHALLRIAFPSVSDSQIEAMLKPIRDGLVVAPPEPSQ